MKATNRIKVLSVVFVLLALGAWFSLQKKFSTNTINKSEGKVAIQDTASITKIKVEHNGKLLVLTKSSDGWVVNGKYKTVYRPMAMMMMGLNQLQVKRPVSQESKSRVLQDLHGKGTKVTVENAEGETSLTFMTNENDINTTYLLTPQSEEPVIAYVPGIQGNINNLFKLTENDWRNRRLFYSNPRTLKSIKVSYPHNPADGFEITYSDGKLELPGVTSLDSSKFFPYIAAFQNIPVSFYLSDKKDSANALIHKSQLLGKVEVSDLDSAKSNSIEVFKDSGNKKDYLGRIGKTGEPVVLNKEIFDYLLAKKSQFIKR